MTTGARTALATLLLLLCLSAAGRTQTAYNVVDIEVEGNRVATKSLILGVSSIAVGTPLTPTIFENTMHRLYGLGLFSDVRIEAEEVPGGLKVFIIVKELPKLTGLKFEGNKKIDDKKLRDELGLGVGGYISPYLIQSKKEAIAKLYSDKGYFQADITPVLVYSPDSTEASLTYRIRENSKVKVEKVIVNGNKRVSDQDLVKKMSNRHHGFLKSSDFKQDKYDEDLKKVIEEYHKKGFIDAFMKSDSIAIDSTTNRMRIYLDVYEGPRYYFGTSTFKNTDVLSDEKLKDVLKYKEGDVFNSEEYDESIFEIYSAYQEVGHLHTQVQDEKNTRSDSIIDVTYTITEGLPSHINLVRITGNNRTKDKVIRRELSVRPGQVFNRSLLIRSVRDAMALNFFSNVQPIPIDLPSGDVDLEFKVDEKQTGQVSAGAGYNSQDKLVGSLGMGIPNFRGMGQNLSFNIEFGSNRNSFSVSFTEPWMFGRPTLFGADIFHVNQRWYDDYTEGRQGFSVRLGRRLRWPDNYFRVGASYRLERNRFYDYSDTFASLNRTSTTYNYYWTDLVPVVDSVSSDTTLSVVSRSKNVPVLGHALPGSIVAYNEDWNTASRISLSIIRDSRNLPEFATKGSLYNYTFENTGGILGGFWRYQKHEFSAAQYYPLLWKFALAAKVEFGAIIGAGNDDRILVSDRFTPGGTAYDGTVRGYEDGILTPDSSVASSDTTIFYYRNPDSVQVGVTQPDSISTSVPLTTRVRGKYMLVANAEIQLPIVKQQIYGLMFFDAGNSWLHFNDIRPLTGLYKGVGFGFRIVVPGIGTIGFDFGKPLDDPPNGDTRHWRAHFQIGTTVR